MTTQSYRLSYLQTLQRFGLGFGLGLLTALSSLPAQAAPYAYIPNYGGNSVTVIDIATNQAIATIPAQANPLGVAIKPDGSRVYVTNYSSNSVTVIDANTNSVITHLVGGGLNGPYGVAMRPDGARAYVANYNGGSVSVINTVNNTLLAPVGDIPDCPHGVAVNPAGTRAYVTRYCTNLVTVLNITTEPPTIIQPAIPVGNNPAGAVVNPAGSRLYVSNFGSNNVTVVNTADNSIVATIPVGNYPVGIAINSTGTRVYVANTNDNNVSVIDTATNSVVGLIPTESYPYGIDVNSAGTRVYTANYYSNSVSVINASNNTLITNVPTTGPNPFAFGRFIGPTPAPARTGRVSLSSGGKQGLGDSSRATVSSNGRYIAFASDAANLVSGDANNASDIFVRDLVTGQTTRVSRTTGGAQANGDSFNPAISADGRYVAFASDAFNLTAGDANNATDIFVHDRQTRQTTRVSLASDGVEANDASFNPSISADGRYVAFVSVANNLAAGDTNDASDVFVRDRIANTTSRVSIATGVAGAQGDLDSDQPAISGNGQFVAFISLASNLAAGDSNNAFDVFVRDRAANTTSRVSIATSAAGAQANKDSWQPFISTDGRYVVFASDATNLVGGDANGVADIFLRDRTANTTVRISLDSVGAQGDGPSYNPVITSDGRYVAFDSYASLVAVDFNGVPDIYLRDRATAKTQRLSVGANGVEANGDSLKPAMSVDGRYVVFESFASNLVTSDTNNYWDIFVRDRGVGSTPGYPLAAKRQIATQGFKPNSTPVYPLAAPVVKPK